MAERPDAVLIAGPTASGKSSLAVETAKRLDGVVVNADSMQVYDTLSVITARPGEDEMGGVEHRLYGHVRAAHTYSVAQWLTDAGAVLDDLRATGRTPVFVGGTGLYFKALEEGLSDIPAIDPAVRQAWRERAEAAPESLHTELLKRDPGAAAMLEPGDTQRLSRALEVFEATGESILSWQNRGRRPGPLAGRQIERHLIAIDRALLHARIEERFDAMIAQGALDEVRALLAQDLSDDLPAMRAIGVRQLAGHLRGEYSLEEAVERAKAATRQFAKRQQTWFRHQTGDDWLERRPFE